MTSERTHDLVFGFVVAVVAFIVYANSLGNGFVWDDDVVILGNAAVKGSPVALFSGIDSGRASETTPYYRPVAQLTFAAEHALHGFSPLWVRLFNVFLHGLNSFLVYRFARLLMSSPWGALLAALLFAVHPLNAETVNFNSGGRNTMLATGFVLGAFLVHSVSVRRASIRIAAAGALLFLLGLFSKESALALLPFIVILELYVPGNWERRLHVSPLRLLPYVMAACLYLALRQHALMRADVVVDIWHGLGGRLLENLYTIPRYLLNLIWPAYLGPRYFVPEDLNLYLLPLTIAWLAIGVGGWWLATTGKRAVSCFGFAWLCLFWLPVSGIFPIPSAPLADRYCYLPFIGICLIVADQTGRMFSRYPRGRTAGVVGSALMLLVLSIVSVRQNRIWHDDVSLFTRMIQMYPEQAYGHHNLGCAYLDKVKNMDLAEKEFETALALDPFFPRLRTQLGFIHLQRGEYEQAILQYEQALYSNPYDSEALLNKGIAADRSGRYAEALDAYRKFLALSRNDLPAARAGTELRVAEIEQLLNAAGK